MTAKGHYIEDIKENTRLEGLFLVQDKNNGMTRNGKPYLALNLSDKTGVVKARVWDNADQLSLVFSQGDVIRVRANSILYQGTLQLNINKIEKQDPDKTDLSDFLPASSLDPENCFAELMDHIATISNPELIKLIDSIFRDETISSAFKKAPAAKSIHHDYIGGLLEHTLNVVRLAVDIAPRYPNVNRDLLLTGAALHDIGKIQELTYTKNFEYSDEGRLVGHITLGYELITVKINALPDFPPDLATIVKHLILSHHGQYDFGSPKRPKTLEAVLLSYLDDIDARMYELTAFIKKEKTDQSKWTGYHKLLNRYIYTDSFVDD
ncbi:MAG: HD domain-containing protein [Deltaproteobacteria bacterium]|nr:HD domain-containing protein [Deltaproteobacteria bacterium]